MVSSIDAAVEVLEVLDKPGYISPQISAFQRDGFLYLVGREAVAIVGDGLPCSPSPNRYDETLKRHVSLLDREKSSIIDSKGKLIKSERQYFEPICFSSEDCRTNLKELLNIWKKLDNLKDDGRIRMISHGVNDHGDISVSDARVMLRDEYFDIMKKEEQRKVEELDEGSEGYVNSSLPGVAVITPYALISFPFSTELEIGSIRHSFGWTNSDSFTSNRSVSFDKRFPAADESPYHFYVIPNAIHFTELSGTHSPETYEGFLERLTNLKDCYTDKVQAIVSNANALHNAKHAKEIADLKDFLSRITNVNK